MQEEQKKLRLPYTKSSGPYANVECKAKASSCKFAKRSAANLQELAPTTHTTQP